MKVVCERKEMSAGKRQTYTLDAPREAQQKGEEDLPEVVVLAERAEEPFSRELSDGNPAPEVLLGKRFHRKRFNECRREGWGAWKQCEQVGETSDVLGKVRDERAVA